MEFDPTDAATLIESGWSQLSALFVSYSLSLVGAIILIIAGYFVAGLVERGVRRALAGVRAFDATLVQFLSTVARYAVLALVLVMVLGQFGVQTASIVAAIGAIGLAIGLALQGTLQNIAAGIMLLILRPLRIGEYVQVGAVAGTVEDIGLFATRLSTADGVYVLAPNSTLWNEPVHNFSRNASRRKDITIGIGYDDDIGEALRVLLGLANSDSRVKKQPAPESFVGALGPSTVDVTLGYWTSTADFFATSVELTRKAKAAFDENGISMPFPQRVVTYREIKGQS